MTSNWSIHDEKSTERAVILQTKLNAPQLSGVQVLRNGVLEKLNGVLGKQVTVLVAPAGYGKTMLLSQYMQRHGDGNIIWLSLEEEDALPARFFLYLASALHVFDHDYFADASMLSMRMELSEAENYLTKILNRMAHYHKPLILIFDDYHTVDRPPFSGFLRLFVSRLPANVHLVTASRTQPSFALTRLRTQGKLLEIGAEELKFTVQEASQLFAQSGLDHISQKDVEALCQSTSGWVTGLRLVALSNSGVSRIDLPRILHDARHFVSEYLREEVFPELSDDLRDFLVKTGFLPIFKSELCAHVMSISEERAQRAIRHIQDANLFITRLGGDDGNEATGARAAFENDSDSWFVYHQLLHEALEESLQHRYPSQISELYDRAIAWYEKNRMYDNALRLAVRRKDYDRAVALFDDNRLDMIFKADTLPLSQWLSRVPAAVINRNDVLCMAQGFCLGLTGDYHEAMTYLVKAYRRHKERLTRLPKNRLSEDTGEVSELRNRLGEICTLLAFVCSINEHPDKASAYCSEAFDNLSHNQSYIRAMLSQTKIAISFRTDYYATYTNFRNLVESQSSTRSRKMLSSALCNLAKFQGNQGLFDEAYRTIDRALVLYPENPNKPMYSMAYLQRGMLDYQRNDLGGARKNLEQGLRVGEYLRMPASMALAHVYLGCIDRLEGRNDSALQNFSDARDIDSFYGKEICLSTPLLKSLTSSTSISREALEKLCARARDVISRGAHPLMSLLDINALHNTAANLLAVDRASEALALSRFLRENCFEGYPLQLTAARILYAAICEALDARHPAHESLCLALDIAQIQGYLRIFADWNPLLHTTLKRTLASNDIVGLDADYLLRLRFCLRDGTAGDRWRKDDATARPENLTEREMTILKLLDSGLSTRATAEFLGIAYETVRTHLSNCYAKLDAHDRVQAIAQARRCGLIDQGTPLGKY
jgi:LuxR family maltose regulon positive regulatory protein